MAGWKVVFIGVLACACFALAMATLLVLLTYEGNQRWSWLAGLVPATAVAGWLFSLYLRHAGHSLDAKPRTGRY
jgi:hypothetical protein